MSFPSKPVTKECASFAKKLRAFAAEAKKADNLLQKAQRQLVAIERERRGFDARWSKRNREDQEQHEEHKLVLVELDKMRMELRKRGGEIAIESAVESELPIKRLEDEIKRLTDALSKKTAAPG